MDVEAPSELKLLEIPTSDNGTEVLWADVLGGVVHVVSVPVFAYGVSRDAVISAQSHGDRLRLVRVLRPSPGATVRIYVAQDAKASDVYTQRILPDAREKGFRIGPATFLDPEIVAFHVADRAELSPVTAHLDGLAREGVLRFWELGDPPMSDDGNADDDDSSTKPWELVHQLPVEGQRRGESQG